MSAAVAAASDPEAERAALAALAAHGRSIDAAIAAFFASAGSDAGTLCAPVTALVAGVGMGARAVDGRCLQPGRRAKRPRGILRDASVPESATAAVPRAVATIALLHAYGAALTLGMLVRRGVGLAEEHGSPRRAELLRDVGRRAAGAMRTAEVQRHLLLAAGPSAGGLFSPGDLEDAMPSDAPAELVAVAPDLGLALPLPPEAPRPGRRAATTATPDRSASARPTHYVVAADSRGVVVALSWTPDPYGLLVPELEVRLARDAVPVRRGVVRVTPGTPCSAPAPIAVLGRPAAGWFAALALEQAGPLEAQAFAAAPASLRELLEQLLVRSRGRSAVAASVQRRRTALTRVTR